MQYLRSFGLDREPFSNEPLSGFYFAGPQHRGAELRTLRGPMQAKGLTVLTGEHGSGKTTLVARLLDALEEERFEVGLMVMVRGDFDADSFLRRLAGLFGLTNPPAERSELLGELVDRLAAVQEEGRQAVAIVDEAQMLAGRDVLEELRGLLNLEYEGKRLLSLVLVGLPVLGDTIRSYAPLAERIDVRVALPTLDAANSQAYLTERLAFVGAPSGLVEPDAVEALHRLSAGVPRLINTLADNALFEAFLAGHKSIGQPDVERAAFDLGVAGVTAPAVEAVLQAVPDDSAEEIEAFPIAGGSGAGADEMDAFEPMVEAASDDESGEDTLVAAFDDEDPDATAVAERDESALER